MLFIRLWFVLLKKSADKMVFYRKRFTKILVPYFLVALPAWWMADIMFNHKNVLEFLKDLLFVTFWEKGELWFWYIPMILLCYLSFPYAFKKIDSSDGNRWFKELFVFVTLIALLLKLENEVIFNNIQIGLLRIPSFFFGSCIGKASYEKCKIPKEFCFIVAVSLLLMFNLRSSKVILYRYTLGIFGIVMFGMYAIILELLTRKHYEIERLCRPIEWFGKYTLELYLVHVAIRGIMHLMGYATWRIRYECLLIGMSIVISVLLKKFSDLIVREVL